MSITATAIDLEDGQAWNDEITFVMRRDEAHAIALIAKQYLAQADDTIKAAMHASAETNPDMVERLAAAFAARKLVESTRLLARAGAVLGAELAPEPLRQELAIALAEARAEGDAEAAKE